MAEKSKLGKNKKLSNFVENGQFMYAEFRKSRFNPSKTIKKWQKWAIYGKNHNFETPLKWLISQLEDSKLICKH